MLSALPNSVTNREVDMETGIGALVVAIILFLIFRAIVLWYWRVNEAITLLKSIDEKLGALAGIPRPASK